MEKKSKRRVKLPAIGISPHQQRTLNEIIHFIDLNGYPPTIKDLAEILGISGPSVHDQVKRLIGKGYLRRDPGKARAALYPEIMRDFCVSMLYTFQHGSTKSD